MTIQPVGPGYFDVMRIPLLHGRVFDRFDSEGKLRVAIISRSLAARLWPGGDATGRRIMLGTPWDTATSGRDLTYGLGWFTIAGVVGDVRGDSVVADPGLDFYVPVYQFFAGDAFFVLRTAGDPAALKTRVGSAILSVDPEQSVFDIRTMQERNAASIWHCRLAG